MPIDYENMLQYTVPFRCPECGQVMLRLVHGGGEAWLDLHGALNLRISLGQDGSGS